MKKLLSAVFLFLFSSMLVYAQNGKIQWLSFEQAVEKGKKDPKPIIVDVYTDWCGYCKKMDKTTFQDEKIASYINENFYAVKFNAESKQPIKFQNQTYEYVGQGKKGVHELAYALLQGKMSYPTIVFLDEEFRLIQPIPGFMTRENLHPILTFFEGDDYKNTPWEEYTKQYKSPYAE
ncbi:thioredoxin fold domain-containing protein [Limibacter armeniacum]|uniref:thioredoxin family protein n=1 Tax=Limibacter armeniacum TaxID=466084 RepID=UPI002FE5E1D7